MSKVETKVIKKNGGYCVQFSIDHQTFSLSTLYSEEGMTSKEYAIWYKKQLDIALKRLQDNS